MNAATKKSTKRCEWCSATQLYIDYHDNEWGVPCFSDHELFELLNLEGAQAGLSWITILNKRENYRAAFNQFDPVKIARYTDKRVEKLLLNPGIVRNRLKVNGVVTNAKLFNEMTREGESFAHFLWSFVNWKPVQNRPRTLADVPAFTDASDAMSKALKKRGFKFVGSTICYAFMQASGMINDHVVGCPQRQKCTTLAKTTPRPAGW